MGFHHNVGRRALPAGSRTQKKFNALRESLASLTEMDGKELLQAEATLDMFAGEIGRKIQEYLLRPAEKIETEAKLSDMGVDSLLSVELARWLSSTFGIRRGVLEIVGSGTMRRFAAATARKMIQKTRANTQPHLLYSSDEDSKSSHGGHVDVLGERAHFMFWYFS